MSKTVDYYHFLISPWSYLAMKQFNDLKAKTGIQVNYLPIDVGTTFSEMGGVPPGKRHPSRQRFRMDELKRWSAHLNVPMNFTPAFFPADASLAARMVHACNEQGKSQDAAALSDAILTAVWNEEKNVADSDTLVAVANACSIDGAALLEMAKSDSVGEVFDACTSQAHRQDVFGSPTFVLDGELFWGQDRISFLERAIG